MAQGPDTVYLGFVERAHGLRGEFVARIFSARGEPCLPPGTRLHLTGFGGVTVGSSKPRDGGSALLSVEEITSRGEAESLRRSEILTDRSSAGELGFFPLYAFIGVELRSGGRSFRVKDIDPIPGNPLLIVEGADGSVFPVPLSLLPEGSRDGSAVEVLLPAGLEAL